MTTRRSRRLGALLAAAAVTAGAFGQAAHADVAGPPPPVPSSPTAVRPATPTAIPPALTAAQQHRLLVMDGLAHRAWVTQHVWPQV